MSFKKFGGLNYAARNNIVGNLYSSSTNSGTTNLIGLENSKIISKSHLDMSANSLMHIGSLYFMDGTIQSTALQTNSSGASIFYNGIIVYNGSQLNGSVIVTGGLTADVITASGLITGNNGLTINTGTTTLQDSNTTTLTASGLITGNNGLTINTGTTTLQDLSASGLITGNNGLTINTGTTTLQDLNATTATMSGTCSASIFTSASDYRIKKDIKNLNELFNVDNLRPVTYINKNTEKQDIGFIAHEVQEEFPYLVNGEKDEEQMQSLNYIGLIGILVKEIQELKKKIKNLENKC